MQLVLPGSSAEGEQVIPVRSFDSSQVRATNRTIRIPAAPAGAGWLVATYPCGGRLVRGSRLEINLQFIIPGSPSRSALLRTDDLGSGPVDP